MVAEIDKELQTTLKQAKAGRPMQFAFVGKGPGGKLLAARKLAPNVIAEAKKAEGGALFKGRLIGEDGQFVFEVAKEPPATLAAQLKRCIKEHTGLTGEVVVRVKADAEAEAAPGQGPATTGQHYDFKVASKEEEARAAKLAEGVAAAQAEAPANKEAGHQDERTRFEQALAALQPRLDDCLKQHIGDASKMRAVMSFAQGKAAAGQMPAAFQALRMLQSLVHEAQAKGALVRSDGEAPSLAVLQQTRLAWDKTRKSVQGELQKLETAILTACKEDEEVDVAEIGGRLKRLYTILDTLDTRLIDKLDEALNAPDAAQRDQLNQQAKGIVNEYLAFVNSDPLVADVDDSGFGAVAVRKTALGTLNLLASKL